LKGHRKALRCLDELPFFDKDNGIPDASTLGWTSEAPQLLSAESCHEGGIPTFDSLWKIVKAIPPEKKVAIGQGSLYTQPFRTFDLELLGDKTAAPVTVWNIEIPSNKRKWSLSLPSDVDRPLTDRSHLKLTFMNIANKGAFAHFHTDKGMLGVSALSGTCAKIWICAEGTEDNMGVLSRYRELTSEAFAQILFELDKPIVIRQTAEHVMFLPPGLIHGTSTRMDGILYGSNAIAWRHIESITNSLLYTLGDDDDNAAKQCIGIFEAATQHIIEHGDFGIQSRAWQCFCSERLRSFREHRWKAEFRGTIELWRLHFNGRDLRHDPHGSELTSFGGLFQE
jgi:hypothetical protein